MKAQNVSSPSPMDRALRMNEQLEDMREKNVSLYDQNQELVEKNKELMKEREGMVQLVTDLNKELDQLKKSSVIKERKLRGELKNMQASWDSLYEEHRAAEEKRERELRAKNANSGGENLMIEEDKVNRQAELLRSAVKTQPVSAADNVSPIEQKLHKLEDENKKLKSRVVQLQTKYREEKYKNENKDLTSATAAESDSEGSSEQNRPTGVNLIQISRIRERISKRNQGRTSNTTPRATQFATKNLWGRMTSSRNPAQQAEYDIPAVNLAFSSDW